MREFKFNDGRQSRGVYPKMFFILSNGTVVPFEGSDPTALEQLGVRQVSHESSHGGGKWSNTTYTLWVLDPEIKVVETTQDRLVWDKVTTAADAAAELSSGSTLPQPVTAEEAMAVLKVFRPNTFNRVAINESLLAKFGAPEKGVAESR